MGGSSEDTGKDDYVGGVGFFPSLVALECSEKLGKRIERSYKHAPKPQEVSGLRSAAVKYSRNAIMKYAREHKELRFLGDGDRVYIGESTERDIDHDGNLELAITATAPFEWDDAAVDPKGAFDGWGELYWYTWWAKRGNDFKVIFERKSLMKWPSFDADVPTNYLDSTCSSVDAVDMDGDGKDEVLLLNEGYEHHSCEILKLNKDGMLQTVFRSKEEG